MFVCLLYLNFFPIDWFIKNLLSSSPVGMGTFHPSTPPPAKVRCVLQYQFLFEILNPCHTFGWLKFWSYQIFCQWFSAKTFRLLQEIVDENIHALFSLQAPTSSGLTSIFKHTRVILMLLTMKYNGILIKSGLFSFAPIASYSKLPHLSTTKVRHGKHSDIRNRTEVTWSYLMGSCPVSFVSLSNCWYKRVLELLWQKNFIKWHLNKVTGVRQ